MTLALNLKTFFTDWIEPVVGWIKDLTKGETLLLIATLCCGAIGAYGTYLFYEPSRGPIIGGAGAAGIELLYIGAAGVAVKRPALRWLAYALMLIGSLGSAYFGVMVSLKEAMPGPFGIVHGVETGNITWPTTDQWIVFGAPAFVEGGVPALSALLLSMFLHSSVSHRLVEADDKQKQIEIRKQMKPFECPFCSYSDDTAAKLWGHFGRCPDANADPRSGDDKRALVRLAVDEGKKRILEG